MINKKINDLESKITELENKFDKLKKENLNLSDNFNQSVYSENFLNINTVSKKKFLIKKISVLSNKNLFIQLKLNILNLSPQTIDFELFCDNIRISKHSNKYQNEFYEISLSGNYQTLINKDLKIELIINPKNNKQVKLIQTTLVIWGINQEFNNEYDAITLESKYCLSYISNNVLYYKIFDKSTPHETQEFIKLSQAKSHSLLNYNNTPYMFYIDINNNLFLKNLNTLEDVYIINNASKISTCTNNTNIYFAYIKSGECFYGEIYNQSAISNKKITSIWGTFSDCYLYYDNIKMRVYLILTKENGDNYLLESTLNNLSYNENINSEIILEISTSNDEENLWIFHSTTN